MTYEMMKTSKGITAAPGIRVSVAAAGLYAGRDRDDMALIVAPEGAVAAGVFTRNLFTAAPVTVSKAHLAEGDGAFRALLINAGCANAATGEPGLSDAELCASTVADRLGCAPEHVLLASTGVIGVRLPMDSLLAAIPALASELHAGDANEAARAIMTTDTYPKETAYEVTTRSGSRYTIGGMCKGSGMIAPDMATMIAVLTTDAVLPEGRLQEALAKAVSVSFNRVTVDSDTSTNDTCILISSGAGAELTDDELDSFDEALVDVCTELARQIARDGEGATKLVDVVVTGAVDEADAERAARTIADSPLVKTAVFGKDANWGRIAAALGRSGASFSPERVDISIVGVPVMEKGRGLEFDEEAAARGFASPEVVIEVDLGAGEASATIWTCDLTDVYISINADYRS